MRPLGRLGVRAGLLLTALLTGCAAEPVTTQGRKIESLYYVTLALAIVIFVGVVGMVLWSVFRFRKQPGDDTLPPQVHGNTTAEIIWTAIPIAIVLVLFAMSYGTLRAVDKQSPDDQLAAVIHVRGYQWFWTFDYGDNKIVKEGEDGGAPVMLVPVGETVRVVMSSDNVNHAFYVPNFLFKKDVISGKPNTFEFRVEVPGRYKGQCAELCGTDHADMVFDVLALPRAKFDEAIGQIKPAGCQGDEQVTDRPEITSPEGETRFDQVCVRVPADRPVTITYRNGGGLPHNVVVADDNTGTNKVSSTTLPNDGVIPSGEATYQVQPLPAGSRTFFCLVHPGMQGEYQVVAGGAE